MEISLSYGWGGLIQNNRSVGKVTEFNSRDHIYVKFPENGDDFHCTLDDIEFTT